MHVCFLSHTADIRGGGERSLVELVRHLATDGKHPITVVSPPGPLVDEIRAISGVEHRRIPFAILRRTSNPFRLVGFAGHYAYTVWRLRRVLHGMSCEVLHANSATAALYGGLAVRNRGIPLVWHMRDIQPPAATFRAVLPLIGRMSSRIIAISEAVKDNLISFGIDAQKISLVYNAVRPLQLHGRNEFRRRWGIGPDELVLGVVGQLLRRKGQMTAVRAFARVAPQLPHAKLVICGGNEDSEYGRSVAAEAERLGVHGRVVFTGFQRDPAPAFDALDILVVPSNQEPFGRVIVEAMLARKPVVATRVGGVPELLRDGKEGFTVEAGDATAMAGAIYRMACEPALTGQMVQRAQARAEERFAWEGRTTIVNTLYEGLSPVGS